MSKIPAQLIRVLLWAMFSIFSNIGASHAAVVITVSEVGADVVMAGSGTVNLTGLTATTPPSGQVFSQIGAPDGSAILGGGAASTPTDLFSGASGPSSWGSGPTRYAISGAGGALGVTSILGSPVLYVPAGYVSGAALNSNSTIAGQTYASLGLVFGVYVYTWASDSLTVIVGLPSAPVATATAGDRQVQLSWTVPAPNGPALTGYSVQYRSAGGGAWNTWPFAGLGTSTTITGLVNGTSYEFQVAAVNPRGTGAQGAATATPYRPPALSYASPVTAYTTAPVTITPSATSVLGLPTYTLTAGTLPAGLVLNAATGVITGTTTAPGGAYPLTVQLSQTSPGGIASSAFTINVVATAPNPQLVYPDYTGPSGVGVTLKPTVTGVVPSGYALAVGSNPLPAGLVLDATSGIISGVPTTAVSHLDVNVTVSGVGGPWTNVVLFTINPTLSYAPTRGKVGSALTIAPSVSALGALPASYGLVGTLPAGLTFNAATGVISGIPSAATDASVTVTLTAASPSGNLVVSSVVNLHIDPFTTITGVPTLSAWGLMLLAGLMALLGVRQARRAQPVIGV